MVPVQNLDKTEQPNCPCCGANMDTCMTSYGTKITVDGTDYFCNNPACYCQTSENKELNK